MRLSKFFLAILILLATSSCTHFVYEAAYREHKNYDITSVDSAFITDSSELVVYTTSQRGDREPEHHQAVYNDSVPIKISRKRRYKRRVVYETPLLGQKVRELKVSEAYPITPQHPFGGGGNRMVDSIRKMDSAGYFITVNLYRRYDVLYGYKQDSFSYENKTQLRPYTKLTRPYYFILMPPAAVLDLAGGVTVLGLGVAAVAVLVVVAIPVMAVEGIIMLFDKDY